jgi:bifunctional enzyme CysN/CysC
VGSIEADSPRRATRSLLRVSTCGGAGDGKSALVASLGAASGVRDFIVAETSAEMRHTRDLLTGASTADVSVIVIDVGKGVSAETRRHGLLLSLLGVRNVVLAVNKMDVGGYAQDTFARVEADFRRFATGLGLAGVVAIPVSAANGDNVRERSAATPWYQGPTLLEALDGVVVDDSKRGQQPLRLPVESVLRTKGELREFEGTIVAGRLRRGDAIRVMPSGRVSRVMRIGLAGADGDHAEATPGQSIAIALEDQVDIARGDLIVPANDPTEVADQFEATVVWMADAPLLPGRGYHMTVGPKSVTASIGQLKYRIDVTTLQRVAGATLAMGEIGVCNLQLDRAIAFDPYDVNRDTGGFILVDRMSGATVGVGMLRFALRRAKNVVWQALDVNKAARSALMGQKACLLWYTGLSGAGKSTIANLVDKKLHSLQRHTYLLDGDNVRHGLNRDLGFTDADRVENIRRIAEVAKLMVDAGLIVSTAFISPFRAERRTARALVAEGEFIEVFIHTPLAVAEERDPKGLYKKARRGDLKNFTGIDSPYETPENPEITIDTTALSPEQAAEMIVTRLRERGVFT